jgi:hypothetical protein
MGAEHKINSYTFILFYSPFMILQLINEAGSLILALGTGIYAYSYMNKFMRALFFQLLVWILFFIAAYAITLYQRSHGMKTNNTQLFNIAVAVEFLILTVAVSVFFKNRILKYLVLLSYVIFLISICLQMKFSKSDDFINYAMTSGSIIMTIFFIVILYKKFKSDPILWKYSPEIWASIGLILYFACNVPYMSILPYLNETSPDMSTSLFHYITDNLANVRYLLLALAFWLVRKKRTIHLSNAIE